MSTDTSPNGNPWINSVTGYVAHLQERQFFSKQRIQAFRHYFLFTIGFLVLIYFLIYIQILFYWLLKWFLTFIFQIISFIFWIPLKTVRFFIPKNIDYDILFPLFWLCSIASFYISKYFHEHICQFYDQQLVRRYRALRYEPHKREEIRRYLFILSFIVLLLLQSLFILLPIAQTIKHHHAEAKGSSISSTVKPSISRTTTMKTPTAKSAVKEAVETMSGNLYNRFIDAFKDENETLVYEKRSPLISDEQLEDTLKTIQKSIQHEITKEKVEKSSRFQRWIVHYLKAPFQKWEPTKHHDVDAEEEDNEEDDDDDEFQSSSSSLMSDLEDSDDEDDDDEEHSTITERIKQGFDQVKHFGEKIQNKVSSSDDEEEEEIESSSLKDRLAKRVKTIGEEVVKKFSSSDTDDDDDDEVALSMGERIKESVTKQMENIQHTAENVGHRLSEQFASKQTNDNKQPRKLTEKIKNVAANVQEKISPSKHTEESVSISEKLKEPLETVKHLGEKLVENIHDKLLSSKSNNDEDSGYDSNDDEGEDDPSIIDRVNEKIIKPVGNVAHQLRDKISSFVEKEDESLIDRTKHAAEKLAKPVKDKILTEADHIHHMAKNFADSVQDVASDAYEKSSEYLKEKADQMQRKLPKAEKVLSNAKHDVVESVEEKVKQTKKVLTKKSEQVKDAVVTGLKSLKKKKKPKSLPEKAKDKLKSIGKSIREKLPGQAKKKTKTAKYAKILRQSSLKFRDQSVNKLNGWFDDAWNVWHLAMTNIGHIFSSSSKHARHLPRYNTTSIYTAYTDLKCYDYTKKRNLYRISKYPHLSFLDSYRPHSPFPVYLSVLKSNGPRCYRQYPDSSCGITLKSSKRSFLTQLYRFFRFWIILGIILAIGAALYQRFTQQSVEHRSFDGDADQSTNRKALFNSSSPLSSTDKRSISSVNSSPSTNSSPLDEQIQKQLRLWLLRAKNGGYQDLSEACRQAMNNTFQKELVSRFAHLAKRK